MTRLLPLLFLLFTCIAITPARAEVVSGLYQAEVPVTDKGRVSREQALLDAFRQVLVKVSGYSGVLEDPAVTEALEQVDRYVRQFRYRTRESAGEAPGGKPLGFWVQFDGAGVEQLLRRNNLPVWGRARPVMLVWLAVEEGGERRLVGSGDAVYAPAIEAQADRRGVPVRIPLLDLTDRTQISASDVWGDFRGTILSASERYESQAVLTGRLYRGRFGEWRVRWALYDGREAVHWADSSPSLEQLLHAGVDAGADTVSLRYTRNYGEAGESVISLRVLDISNLQDYSRTLRYLNSVSGVAQVQVTEMGPGYAVFRLSLDGASSSVIQALALGDVMITERAPRVAGAAAGATGAGTQLVYRLLK